MKRAEGHTHHATIERAAPSAPAAGATSARTNPTPIRPDPTRAHTNARREEADSEEKPIGRAAQSGLHPASRDLRHASGMLRHSAPISIPKRYEGSADCPGE